MEHIPVDQWRNPSEALLELIFGSESSGATARKRATSSSRKWVVSQYSLSYYDPDLHGPEENVTTLLSSDEALTNFGLEKLGEVIDSGSAAIVIM